MATEGTTLELKDLIFRRGQLKSQITRFAAFVDNNEHDNVTELKSRLKRVEGVLDEFENVQSRIEALDINTQHEPERVSFEDKFFGITTKAQNIIDSVTSRNRITNAPTLTGSQTNVPNNSLSGLPSINLPQFHGTYEGWVPFFEIFKSLIHENMKLSKIQKFYYLQSCLRGDATLVIHSLEISETNYDTAIDLLKERYENKRVLIRGHVKAIYDMPVIKKESHIELRNLLDNFLRNFRALKGLGQPVETWDTLLIYLITTKLDQQSNRDWEGSVKKDVPELDDLLKFLKGKCQLLESLDSKVSNKFNVKDSNLRALVHVSTDNHASTITNNFNCAFCKQKGHSTYKCQKLLALSYKSRYFELKKAGICTNCLRTGHSIENCNGKTCQICHKRHNSILHDDNFQRRYTQNSVNVNTGNNQMQESSSVTADTFEATNNTVNNVTNSQTNSQVTLASHNIDNNYPNKIQILLATAIVHLVDQNNKLIKCRALLDSASQSNFCTKELFERLNLKGSRVNMPISGISQTACNITNRTRCQIQAVDGSYKAIAQFLVIDNITSNLPQISFDISQLNIPNNIILADPKFHLSQKIDLLLGAEIFFELLNNNQIKLGHNKPMLQGTKLGWILAGPVQILAQRNEVGSSKCFLSTSSLNEQLQKFWEIESFDNSHIKLSNEELECEMDFRKNVEQCEGKYTVKLPLKNNYVELGESLTIAKNRFQALENRLAKNPELRKHYVEFLKEYEDLGHMSKTDICLDNPTDIHNYLPHHAVVKDTSTTTKVRVVFDASSKTSSNLSLNDVLKVGPKVQNDLFDILVRMRKHEIVIVADVEKMYRMINVHESQRNLQRIIWRDEPNKEISHYTLNTVTYGTASASFLATRTLNEIGLRCKDINPQASEVIMNDFYMDDLISGSNSLENAIKLKNDIYHILGNASFKLRKWISNDLRVFQGENLNSDESEYQLSQETKTLGVNWDSKNDLLHYTFNISINAKSVTKRIILSSLAQLFDPLGLISPCIVQLKVILQQLWQSQIEWDQPISESIKTKWVNLIVNINCLNTLKIPRCVVISQAKSYHIHGFCDSSQYIYGACVYLSSENAQGDRVSHLICSKSRLAPIKSISLPKLELCGALLLAQLMQKTIKALRIQTDSINYWTDSTIVLSWLNAEPNCWKIFVSNRVAEIQNLTENGVWRHIESQNNPADIVSRGCETQKLANESLWWHGPAFLLNGSDEWPTSQIVPITNIPEARKENITLSFKILNDYDIFESYSTYHKLLRVVAFILRFIYNCKSKNKIKGFLSTKELDDAKVRLCKIVQQQSFPIELKMLQNSKIVKTNSKLYTLNPFLDSDGLIRVGGRLLNSNLSFDHKYPIVLPSKHKFTRLLIKHVHHKYLHAGAQFVLSQIRSQFWPINGKSEVRSVLRQCITCFKVKPPEIAQLMSGLPEARVTVSRPFTYCGVDYTGPYLIKDGKLRNRMLIKAYFCIFICLATKAVHVEIVTDLTTEGFLNSFKRFTSRRGLCKRICSDNAKNFVGADNYLKQIHELIENISKDQQCHNYFLEHHVEWDFIPARSPHFGGIWEAAVKSFKYHIKRVIGDQHLTYEQLLTVVTQIESVLNSRPILPLSNDPTDLLALTPGHFLIGSSLVAVPQEDVTEISHNRLNHFKQLQQLVQNFWTRWSRDYLHTLQQRAKWCKVNDNIKIDALVLLKEDNVPPMQWRMGRVVSVHPGPDNLVRVVSVLTNGGVLKRAITKICPLPINDIQY